MSKITALWQQHRGWIWADAVLPFFATRAGLLLVAAFAQLIATDPAYPYGKALGGWTHWLDIWNRWDASWYMEIIQKGYYLRGDLPTTGSNLAFFPLYPLAVKAFLLLVPDAWEKQRLILLVGVVLSNLCLLASLLLLHRLVSQLSGSEDARRAVFYLLAAPTSFYFSAFYSEALFLLCWLAAFYAASRHSWFWAGLAGALSALCRPVGVLIVAPLGLWYLRQVPGGLRLRRDVLWLGLVPAALLAFLLWQMPISGDFFGPFTAHSAWGRGFSLPWEIFSTPASYNLYVERYQYAALLFSLLLALLACLRLPAPYGAAAGLLAFSPLLTGTLLSFARFATVVFPFYIVLAQLGRRPWLDRLITSVSLALQGLLMAAWVLYYPVY